MLCFYWLLLLNVDIPYKLILIQSYESQSSFLSTHHSVFLFINHCKLSVEFYEPHHLYSILLKHESIDKARLSKPLDSNGNIKLLK